MSATATHAQAGGPRGGAVPRLSLGMPLYNAERYVAQAFDGLLAQDFADFEIIVSDNASTDRTWEICEQYARRDPRIRLYRNPENLGAAYNYNRTVDLARGPLFRWVAYDDVCAPTLLRRCVDALDADADAILAYPQTMLIDDDGAPLRPYRDGLDLRSAHAYRRVAQYARHWSLCNAVFGVMRSEVLRASGRIRPYPSSDVVLLAELAALGQFHEVPERLFFRRIHQASSRQGSTKNLATVAAWFDPKRVANTKPRRIQLVRRVTGTLAGLPAPLPQRLSCIAAFAAVWALRKAHMKASRVKHAVLDRAPAASRPTRRAGADASREAK
ncbi:glycosyltransferase [Jiangella sp. DSM 45060]|uniref:glycosyltransferase family 2 protein n=1 Tax=Jiangella sp. DSM 45060 TaxID=1798224 RepID=UPI00087C7F6D|nr:glycosyltransferase [Jiangella sp. DSM 45060]SDT58779.1 Glycosyltransferase involved in cell wall bisynthesis [Jiangella sp. DSM 45060]